MKSRGKEGEKKVKSRYKVGPKSLLERIETSVLQEQMKAKREEEERKKEKERR